MKKILAILGLAGILSTSGTVGVLNSNINNQTNVSTKLVNINFNNPIDNYEAIYEWTDVNINHYVQTKATGTHTVDDIAFSSKATGKSWNSFFMKSKLLVVSGSFTLHTHTGPQDNLSNLIVNINEAKSNNLERVWESSVTNDKWLGWGHQTSTVTLTVIAKYDEKEEVTSLSISSYIYARTAGAVHVCKTSSQVNIIRFIVD